MKRHFLSSLKACAVGVMTLLAVSAVSCTDELEADLSDVKDEIASIKEKLTELEAKLTTEVSGLNTKLAALEEALGSLDEDLTGKIEALGTKISALGVTKVEKNDAGVVTLTFLDETTLQIKPQDNTGLVTVKEVDGVKYWALSGSEEVLAPVAHPDVELKFRVNSSNTLEFSKDNGATWTETDAVFETIPENLVTYYNADLDWDWEDDTAVLVIGDLKVEFPLYEAILSVKAGKTYFTPGEEKSMDLNVANITEFYVMTKPEGWRANLNGKVLIVKAPEAGVGEEEGNILLHGTTSDGKCKIASLRVSTTDGFKLTVNETTGEMSIVNPLLGESQRYDSLEGWVKGLGFQDFVFGFAPIAAFQNDPKAYVQERFDNYDDPCGFMSNVWGYMMQEFDKSPVEYEEGVCEVAEYTGTVKEFYKGVRQGVEMPRGTTCIIWACPYSVNTTTNEYVCDFDNLSYVYYMPIELEAKALEVTFDDVKLELTKYGAASYAMGYIPEEYLNGKPFSAYFNESILNALVAGYINYADCVVSSESGEEEVMLSSIVKEGYELVKLSPLRKYYFWMLPILDGKDWADYSYDDVVLYDFTTAGLEKGSAETVEISEPQTDYLSLSATITASKDANVIYYKWYEVGYDAIVEDVAADIIATGYMADASYGPVQARMSSRDGLLPGQTRVLVALASDKEGKYGECSEETLTALKYEYKGTFTPSMTVESQLTYSNNWGTYTKVSFKVEAENLASVKYYCALADHETFTDEYMELTMPIDYYAREAELATDGTFTEELEAGKKYRIGYIVCNEAGEDVYGSMTFDTEANISQLNPVSSDDASYNTYKPSVTISKVEVVKETQDERSDYKQLKVTWSIDVPEGCKAYAAFVNVLEVKLEDADAVVLNMVCGEYGTKEYTGKNEELVRNYLYEGNNWGTMNDNDLVVTWVDADGNYYEPLVLDLAGYLNN